MLSIADDLSVLALVNSAALDNAAYVLKPSWYPPLINSVTWWVAFISGWFTYLWETSTVLVSVHPWLNPALYCRANASLFAAIGPTTRTRWFERQLLGSENYNGYNRMVDLVIHELVSDGTITKQQQNESIPNDPEQRYETTQKLDRICKDFIDSGLSF